MLTLRMDGMLKVVARRHDTRGSHQGDGGVMSTQAPPLGTVQEKSINLRALLDEMIQRGASDLHITAGERPKLRIDGEIVNARRTRARRRRTRCTIAYSILTEAQKKRFETEDELDFSFGIANLSRFRGNVFKQRGCVSMAIRRSRSRS
jgi:twitching motility protein PilT